MAEQFAYRVCQIQYGVITFVNDRWIGKLDIQTAGTQAAIQSCPRIYQYLEHAGKDGWELINIHEQTVNNQTLEYLYMKKRMVIDA